MSWMVSVFVGFLTGVLGLLAAGFIAAACVSWYHISSFEGKSGYFMAAIALLGGMAGVIIGMVTGRLLAEGHTLRIWRQREWNESHPGMAPIRWPDASTQATDER